MAICIKVNGKMVKNKVREYKFGKMEIFTRDIIIMTNQMEKADLFLTMVTYMKDNS